MREPCGCGATDCPECYPMSFYRGRYIYRSCDDCGEEFEPEDQEDESRRCPDCQRKADGIRECAECGENFDFKGEETICPACKEHCEWVDDENENNHPTRAKLINLGWANGWPEGKLPPIANACQLAFMDGEPHNYYEQPQPHLGSCVHRVVCETCGYEYLYDSGD